MYNCYISFRNAFINKFGPVLGYLLMVICMFTTVSIVIFLFRILIKLAAGLLIACLIVFGIYYAITRYQRN